MTIRNISIRLFIIMLVIGIIGIQTVSPAKSNEITLVFSAGTATLNGNGGLIASGYGEGKIHIDGKKSGIRLTDLRINFQIFQINTNNPPESFVAHFSKSNGTVSTQSEISFPLEGNVTVHGGNSSKHTATGTLKLELNVDCLAYIELSFSLPTDGEKKPMDKWTVKMQGELRNCSEVDFAALPPPGFISKTTNFTITFTGNNVSPDPVIVNGSLVDIDASTTRLMSLGVNFQIGLTNYAANFETANGTIITSGSSSIISIITRSYNNLVVKTGNFNCTNCFLNLNETRGDNNNIISRTADMNINGISLGGTYILGASAAPPRDPQPQAPKLITTWAKMKIR